MIPVSVVIPVLDAEHTVAAAVGAVSDAVAEVIVVDGGSADGTIARAQGAGATVLSAPRGRGSQLAAGADAAQSDWLLFLHADTRPGSGWKDAVWGFIGRPGADERAAAFRFALDDDAPGARRIERFVAWRCRVFGLPYGDQGLLISRAFYEALGGYRSYPLFEDVDLVRRIGRERIVLLDTETVTSAARYRRSGYFLRPVRNFLLLSLYLGGVPPRMLARLYG